MFLLKLLGKVMLIPVWILVSIAWIFVKAVVSIYSFARGFVVFGLGVLIVGTLLCYHDLEQVIFLICICILSLLPLLCGSVIEVFIEQVMHFMRKMITC